MIFALVGGDERAVFLAGHLAAAGHGIKCFALEKALDCTGALEDCVKNADCVIVGVPAIKNGVLHTPLSDRKLTPESVFSLLTPEQTLCGGFGSCDFPTRSVVFNFLQSESFALGNAALTAEGALALLIEGSPDALYGSEILLLGAGRIAKALQQRLGGFCASVTVGARSDGSLAKALSEFERFDTIINTVPARIIPVAALRRAKRGAVIMELASASGGFDRESAEKAGLTVIYAPGLPGRFCPRASAELMEKDILKFMEAEHEQ